MIVPSKRQRGHGLLNNLINKLPIELHLPGYRYCGPGTKLEKRLARGDSGINPLDEACKEHDIAYSKNRENIEARNVADRILANKAWQRVKAKDSSIGERAAAFAVTNAMNIKNKLGMGVKRTKMKRHIKKTTLNKIIKAATTSMIPSRNSKAVISSALKGARAAVKNFGGKKTVKVPRILPVTLKTGGFLPFLVPIFAGLSATGALAGGAAGIAKAINDAKAAKLQLEENQRHNKKMEDIALGKGLYLKPYKKGYGLLLKSNKCLRKKKLQNKFTSKSSFKHRFNKIC